MNNSRAKKKSEKLLPLAVDLDGTLINADMLVLSLLSFIRINPFSVYKLFGWLLKGKIELKEKLAKASKIDVSKLPYNKLLVKWLKEQKLLGREIVLATACNHRLAEQVAAYLGFFDKVYATDTVNLKGKAKQLFLVHKYGYQGFDYIGNDWIDLKVWEASAGGYIVSNSTRLIKAANKITNIIRVFNPC